MSPGAARGRRPREAALSPEPNRPSLNVGLTGNVASGKSSVAALFRQWGATVIDADQLAREAQAPGSPVLAALAARFGADVLRPDGSLDRAALRRRVMGNPVELAALNAIVHPEVFRRRAALLRAAAARGDRIVVTDVPLLFEAADPAAFDAIVLVDAPPPLRRERLIRDRGLAPDEADALIASQLPADTKRARSDFVIVNDSDRQTLERRAREVWEALQHRAP